ncbi:excinuclease ABC subunit UvrA [soil metagenome]
MPRDSIRITGARQHNLKDLTLEIPRDRLVVITGVSGSGKSSLAFDTLYAEGQRRYVESLSAYARQFLDRLEKPDVDFIEGLSPAIAIEQRSSGPNPRSTVATATEIYDYLRVLYASAGQPHDPETGAAVTRRTVPSIAAEIAALPPGTKLMLLAPLVVDGSGGFRHLFERLQKQGFVRVRIDGEIRELEDEGRMNNLDRDAPHTIEAVIDRLVVREGLASRLHDSLNTALKLSRTEILILVQPPGTDGWDELRFTTSFANPETGFRMPDLHPRLFSFNSHQGACPTCHGLGSVMVCDPDLFVPDPARSIAGGAVRTWWSQNKKLRAVQDRGIAALLAHFELDPQTPFRQLPDAFRHALFHGTGQTPVRTALKAGSKSRVLNKPFEGLAVQAQRLHDTSDSEITRRNVRRFLAPRPCPDCSGQRLKPEILAVTLASTTGPDLGIHQFVALPVEDARAWLGALAITPQQKTVCSEVVAEIFSRLGFLEKVGLGYLTLDRESATLSGGEAQRIRLASQIGSGLTGVLYVLDEPSIGLHQHDNARLIETLTALRDLGNSVIVVEHDEETIRAADHLLDLGPGAGPHGGEIMAQGTPAEVAATPASPTGRYLSGELSIPVPKHRTKPAPAGVFAADGSGAPGWLTVHGAAENNLQNIDAAFPVGCLTCVTGASGSGKSTLVDAILMRALSRFFYRSKASPCKHRAITGLGHFDKAIVIDQSPIGRSPRSNPATYVGAFDPVRKLFAGLPAARIRGYTPGHFSFNVEGGRCETCKGDGALKIDMHFLSDVYVTCEACDGQRFNTETLEITYKGKNIAEILGLTIEEGARFFARVPTIAEKLRMLCEVGLGYLHLGQAATTLSGGEAQRVKLAAELAKRATGQTLYLLDEPTTGLHFADIDTLLAVLYRLRDAGNTLIVIEHNLDVIKCADHVVDLGPGGGNRGGRIVAQGTPESVAATPDSLTGLYLAKLL